MQTPEKLNKLVNAWEEFLFHYLIFFLNNDPL